MNVNYCLYYINSQDIITINQGWSHEFKGGGSMHWKRGVGGGGFITVKTIKCIKGKKARPLPPTPAPIVAPPLLLTT